MFQCRLCEEKFGGERAFDMHRRGGYVQNVKPGQQHHRTCITPRQMVNRDMVLNGRGVWVTRAREAVSV